MGVRLTWEQIQEKYPNQWVGLVDVKYVDNDELQKDGIDTLKNALGVVDTIRFLEQFDHGGSGDYTAEKYNIAEEPEEEIRKKLGLWAR